MQTPNSRVAPLTHGSRKEQDKTKISWMLDTSPGTQGSTHLKHTKKGTETLLDRTHGNDMVSWIDCEIYIPSNDVTRALNPNTRLRSCLDLHIVITVCEPSSDVPAAKRVLPLDLGV
jgi:hypothetical protein